jgi:hypothetical protein
LNQDRPRCIHPGCTNLARRRQLCDTHRTPLAEAAVRHGYVTAAPDEQLASDRKLLQSAAELTTLRLKYKTALKDIERLERERDTALDLGIIEPCIIRPRQSSGTNEATVFVAASDWHVEEEVDPRRINGLNKFNLEIAQERVTTFWQKVVELTKLLQQDVKIEDVVIALLGDFISGDIHEEVEEVCLLPPTEAVMFALNLITGGLEFLLTHLPKIKKFRLQCHSGNHGRTTKTTRFATENGHSLEYLLYRHLATHFKNNPRVEVEIAEGYHSYVEVYGRTYRFHHGHALNYGGGVGGLTIPTNKAIDGWNKGRPADLDIFGHFHQQFDGNRFLANGSLIGYNSYALSIKAPYDVPKQTMWLCDKKHGRTFTMPIFFKR